MSRNIGDLHPRLQEKVALLLEMCKAHGLNVLITDCVRNKDEQEDCVNRGASSVHYPNSHHNWGTAFDFCRNVKGREYDDSDGFFTKVGKIGESIGLEWGGSWKSPVDKPHFQMPDWGTGTANLVKKYGTPSVFKASWVGATPNTSAYKEEILAFQKWLNGNWLAQYNATIDEDGIYGSQTKAGAVKALQLYLNFAYGSRLDVDGIFGPITYSECRFIERGSKGDMVYILQGALYGNGIDPKGFDGYYGEYTYASVVDYQRAHKLDVDGVAGKKTFQSLFK